MRTFHLLTLLISTMVIGACCKDCPKQTRYISPPWINCGHEARSVLAAHYSLDNSPNDITTFQHHGAIHGPTPTANRFGETHQAMHFDGEDDVIRVSDNPQLYLGCNFTISAWIYPEEIKSQIIVRKGPVVNGPNRSPYGLSLSGTNDIIFSVSTSQGFVQARKSGYDTSTWYLLTGVLNQGNMTLYVNGEFAASAIAPGYIIDENAPLLIGTRLQLPSSTFAGAIDDVRLYNYALSAEEVMALFEE